MTTTGPIFHCEPQIETLVRNIESDVADRLKELWLANLDSSIRVNSGHYVSLVNVRQDPDGYVLNDGRCVYGPWLEGTGSRNSPNTRFPGYFSQRRALETGQAEIDRLVEPAVSRFVQEVS